MIDTLVHADWSKNARKRFAARARRASGGFHVDVLADAGGLDDYFDRWAGGGTGVVFGFDFPIGVPEAYARRAGLPSFPALLSLLGSPPWHEFHVPATRPEEIALTRPFYPRSPGGTSRADLTRALAIDAADMKRRCERITGAEWLFWTLGGKQVGRAALSGWRGLLAPQRERAGPRTPRIWPFDGAWSELEARGGRIVVESYPAAAYGWLGFPRDRWSKRVQAARAARGRILLDGLDGVGVTMEDEIRDAVADGFGANADGEDRFDAVVGLCGMLGVVHRRRAPISRTLPPATLQREGWIFGV